MWVSLKYESQWFTDDSRVRRVGEKQDDWSVTRGGLMYAEASINRASRGSGVLVDGSAQYDSTVL